MGDDKIERMVYAALTSMEAVEDSSAAEVLSAAYTVALRCTGAILIKHPALRNQARQAAEVLLMECAVGDRQN